MKKFLLGLVGLLAITVLTGGCSGTSGDNVGPGGFQPGLTPEDISGCYNILISVTSNNCGSNFPSYNSLCIDQDGSDATVWVGYASEASGTLDELPNYYEESGSNYDDSGSAGYSAPANYPAESEPGYAGGSESMNDAGSEPGNINPKTTFLSKKAMNLNGTVSGYSIKVEENTSSSNGGCAASTSAVYIGTVSGDSISGTINVTMSASSGCTTGSLSCAMAATFSGTKTSSAVSQPINNTGGGSGSSE